MSGLDELRISFFQECEDLLDSLGEGLRAMSDRAAAGNVDDDIETVHAVFRAVHSIKGGAGAFGLDDLVTFAHLFETVLDENARWQGGHHRGRHACPAARRGYAV